MKELPLPQQIEKLDAARLRAYQENLSFYQGQQWSSRPRGRERHLTFNYARSFIDKVTSYLMSGLTVAVEPWDGSPEARERAERATARLRQVAEANILEQLDLDTEIDAALLGDGCYKVTWGGEGVRVSAPDVQGVCDTVSPI